MRNKVIWGFAILIILLIGVSVFLLTRTTETEPEIIYRPPTPAEKKEVDRNIQEIIDKAKKDQPPIAEVEVEAPPVEIEKPKPVKRATAVTCTHPDWQPSSGRVGSDYPLLIETENPVIDKQIYLRTVDGTGIDLDWESLSPEEVAEWIKRIENFEVQFSDGYSYKHRSDGSLILDERGFPILRKKGEPSFSLFWRMRFKPSPEQLVRYNELLTKHDPLLYPGPEGDAARAELEKLKRENMGPVPRVQGMSISASQFDPKTEQAFQLMRELQAKVLRQANLEHLIGLYN